MRCEQDKRESESSRRANKMLLARCPAIERLGLTLHLCRTGWSIANSIRAGAAASCISPLSPLPGHVDIDQHTLVVLHLVGLCVKRKSQAPKFFSGTWSPWPSSSSLQSLRISHRQHVSSSCIDTCCICLDILLQSVDANLSSRSGHPQLE